MAWPGCTLAGGVLWSYVMLRRLGAVVSLLGLLAVEPGLFSLCALAANLHGDCATPATRMACDQMNAAQPDTQISAQARAECCRFSSEPVPEAPGKASAPSWELLKNDVVILPLTAACGAPRESNAPVDPPPPDLLPLLCTFLI